MNGVVNEDINSISTGVVTAIRIPILLTNRGNESALGPTVTFDLPRGTGFIRAFDIATVSIYQNLSYIILLITNTPGKLSYTCQFVLL